MRALLLLPLLLLGCSGQPTESKPENPWQRHFHPELSWGDRMIIENCRRCPGCCAGLDDVGPPRVKTKKERCKQERARKWWIKQQPRDCEGSDDRDN